jgi:hypothetical protein
MRECAGARLRRMPEHPRVAERAYAASPVAKLCSCLPTQFRCSCRAASTFCWLRCV